MACRLSRISYGLFALLLLGAFPLRAEVELIGKEGKLLRPQNQDWTLTAATYLRSDMVMMNNLLDLDSKQKKDRMSYFGIYYSLDLKLKYLDNLEIFTQLLRAGPAYDTVPVLGRRSVSTNYGNIDRYRNKEYLPELKQYGFDVKLPTVYELRTKVGLFMAEPLGHGLAGMGYYDNYGVTIYHPSETWAWTFHYERPEWANQVILGPVIESEERMGRGDHHDVEDFFSLDTLYSWQTREAAPRWIPKGSFQPYLTFLSDRTGAGKRSNSFAIQTEQDLLGTLGADLRLEFGRLKLGFEAARNFGRAKAKGGVDDGSAEIPHAENITHKGYFLYSDISYDLHEYWLTPRGKMLVASGNKLDDTEGGAALQGSTNRAFSVYSPTNAYHADTLYQARTMGPLAAMGNGFGSNGGILRPGTFGDPYLTENLIAPNLGFDVTPHERVTFSFDWWYLSAFEPGVGTWDGVSKKLPRDLGHEVDWGLVVKITKNIEFSSYVGYFIPGRYYHAHRDDAGTGFSPLIRGDGDADNAFHGEISLAFNF